MISKFLKFPFFLALIAVLLVACNKDNDTQPDPPTTEDTTNPIQIQSLVVADSTGCYEILFPITFLYEDGTTQTANSEEDLEEIFDNEPYPINIEFPINLQDPATGETVMAADEEELEIYLDGCDFDDDDWDDEPNLCDSIDLDFGQLACYNFVFPISFVLEDGTTVTAQSADDLATIFDVNNEPEDFVYPISLEHVEDGEIVTANNEEELDELLENCFDWDDDDWDDEPNLCDSIDLDFGQLACYNFVFPISFVLEDGTTVTAQSADDLATIFDANNEPEDFVYPVSLEHVEDGEVVTANNEEELGELLENCFDWDNDWDEHIVYAVTFVSIADDSLGDENCYTYVYPINILTENGETLIVNNDDELLTAIFGNEEIEDFVYPFQVINNEDGTTITVNNEEDAEDLVENCD